MIKNILLKYITIFSLLIFGYEVSGQEIVFEESVKLKGRFLGEEKRRAFTMISESGGLEALLLLDANSMHAFLFDNGFEEFVKLMGDGIPEGYFYQGGFSSNKKYTFYFARSDKKSLSLLKLDINRANLRVHREEFEIPFKEVYLNSFVYDNQLIVLSSLEKGADLKIRKISDKYNITESILNFSEHQPNLSYIFYNFGLREIEDHTSYTATYTSGKSKMYRNDDKVIFTFDDIFWQTRVFTINLENLTYEFTRFRPKTKAVTGTAYTSNSYLLKNYLYQVFAGKDYVDLFISDVDTGELLSEIPLIVKKSKVWNVSANSKTDQGIEVSSATINKALRNFKVENLGIFICPRLDTNLVDVTIHGYNEAIVVDGGPTNVSGGFGVSSSTVPFSGTRGAKFTSTINIKSLKYFDGEYHPKALDKIIEFEGRDENYYKKLKIKFRHNETWYYGQLDHKTDTYTIRKFKGGLNELEFD